MYYYVMQSYEIKIKIITLFWSGVENAKSYPIGHII